uniref:Retrotransposon protein, putative, unclassified n=1 Tax=Oryza sativa subsp. japonica TaxID=39947 RepID=Q2QR67_ORYSJ|nr:retrotransposon protein, putative, unclassified [Oryza sativa Japonica Group]
MEREAGGIEPEPLLGRMVAVEDYISCGFLPPPSEFLLLVLNFYGLSLLHLNPKSIAFLSIFSYLCEAYIGVESFLDPFRFYYELRWMEPKKVSGCVGFRLRDGLKSRYIPFQCPSSRSKWRARWFYLQIENSDPVFVVLEEQPDKIPEWTAKPALTPFLQSFIDVIDDLRVRGLSGYKVAADFISRRIQLLQAQTHPAFDYPGPKDTTRVSPQGLKRDTVEHRVGQVMISSPTTASNIPAPLCEKGTAEHEAAINVAASLKEGVAKEASDIAASATTSGSNVPKKGRKFSSILGNRQKAPTPLASDASPPPQRRQRLVTLGEKAARAKAAQDGSGAASSGSPAAASTDVVVVAREWEVTPSGPAGGLVPAQGLPADILSWGELQSEMERILQAGARGVGCEIEEARAAASSANERANMLARDLAEAREDLVKMRELVAGNERQRQGHEHRMSELENILSKIRGSLRVSYTGLHQLVGECCVTTTIPANPDEFSLTDVLARGTGHGDDLESELADRDRRIQYWRTKFEVAELERTMVEVKKDQAVEALRGREVWFNSYLRSCYMAMAGVCRELQVPRRNPEESAARYISWLNGACAQLEGIGKRSDEALKQECRRSSRFVGGHVLACIRDHRPQLHLEFLHEGFSCSRRAAAEIDGLAKSMAPLAEKVFQSMDWCWPSW